MPWVFASWVRMPAHSLTWLTLPGEELIDGTSDEPNPKNPVNFYKLNFKTYYLTLNVDESTAPSDYTEKKPKETVIQIMTP